MHAQIAILTNSCSDDVFVGQNEKLLAWFSRVSFSKSSWKRKGNVYFALHGARFVGKFIRPVFT